jgi:hypothetical protein
VAPAPGPRPKSLQPPEVVNVRTLLRDREFIKVTAYVLPRQSKLHVLEMMEKLRLARTETAPPARARDRVVLPDMTSGEIVREINWRLGTLPPDDAEALARYVRRLTNWRLDRRRRNGSAPASPAPPRRR